MSLPKTAVDSVESFNTGINVILAAKNFNKSDDIKRIEVVVL